MGKQKYKRRQYIVDPEFQYGVIRKIAFLSILFIIMALSFLTVVNYLYGDLQFELVQPDPFAEAGTLDTLDTQRTLLDLLWPVLAACLGVTLVVTFVFGVLFSHRMAGPIFRIRRTILEMADGNLKGLVFLRKKDDFKALAEALNALKKSLWQNIGELRQILETLETGDTSRQAATLESFRRVLDRFRTE